MLAVSTPLSVMSGVGTAVVDGVGIEVSPRRIMRAVGVGAANGSDVTVGRRAIVGEGVGIFAVAAQPARTIHKARMSVQE
jgi:hypothetical protein